MTREERKKKNKRLGWILTGTAHVILVLILFAFGLPAPEPQPEPALVLDFRSSSSSEGGSSSEITESDNTEQGENNPVDPVVAQDKKSPVKSSDKKKGGDTQKKATRKANSEASAAGAFGGGGKGKSKGKGEDDIPGKDGKGGGGGTGFGTIGSGDGNRPDFTNPTQETGKVMVKLYINRSGEVTSVEVLSTHSRTTTSDAVLLSKARKDGEKFKFSANSKREETCIAYRVINYTLR